MQWLVNPRFRPVVVALTALLLLWPALVNGGPFFTTDTIAYIRGPDQAVMKVLGPSAGTVWSTKSIGMQKLDSAASPVGAARTPPMAGRSIYYGLLANLGARTGGFWLTIALQALAAAYAIDLLCRALGWTGFRTLALVVAASAILTPLAFYVDCLMPDVWAAIAVLVAAAVSAGGERLKRADHGLALLMLAYAGAAHTSLIAVLSAIALAGLILAIVRNWIKFKVGAPGALISLTVLALVAAIAAGSVFTLAVKAVYGEPPLQPPFLTARIVGDGHAGEGWLKQNCPQTGFQACKFASRLPMTTDDFLWSAAPNHSAFWTATPTERRALGQEQARLVSAIVRDRPTQALAQFAADGAAQAMTLSLEDFDHKPTVRRSIAIWMTEPQGAIWRGSLAYRQAWPIHAMNLGLVAVVISSLVGLAALTAQTITEPTGGEPDIGYRLLFAAFVVLAALAANALVCGGFSGVIGRYQARIVAPLILLGVSAWIVVAQRYRGHAADVALPLAARRHLWSRNSV